MADTFSDLITRKRDELAAAEALQEIANKYPDIAKAWAIEHTGRNGTHPKRSRSHAAGTIFDKIAALLVERNNKPIATPEFIKALNSTRGAIGAVLYNTHAEEFQGETQPGNAKLKFWRLTDAAFKTAKESGKQ